MGPTTPLPDEVRAIPGSRLLRLSALEKARLTAGVDMWTTHPEPRLGLQKLRLSDGPAGVSGWWDEREAAWCTPCGTGLAATWDPTMVRCVGDLVAKEATRAEVQVLLGPMINIPRSPLGGRCFECFSEDPWLSGTVAAAWIEGVQARGVAACPKHLVCNDAETSRTTVDCVVDEKTLREIYLIPFELAIRAGAWTIMTAYNRVNGTYCSEHRDLLTTILREEWGFDGVSLCDWFGAHDGVAAIRAGLDLEMPGPGNVLGEALAPALEAGLISESELDVRLQRLHRLTSRVGRLSDRGAGSDRDLPNVDGAAEQRLLTEVAADGFVLLTNDRGVLPLQPERLARLAIIGPNAAAPSYHGGGSAGVNMRPATTPLEAVKTRYADVEIVHEPGCPRPISGEQLQLLDIEDALGEAHAVTVEYLATTPAGREQVLARETRHSSFLHWMGGMPGLGTQTPGRVRATTTLTPRTTGAYTFRVCGSGRAEVRVAGRVVASLEAQGEGPDSLAAFFTDEFGSGEIHLSAGVPVTVEVLMQVQPGMVHLLTATCSPPRSPRMLEDAVAAARASDAAVVVVGHNEEIEAESRDRRSTALPGGQVDLIRRVAAVNRNTIVVLNVGAPVDLPWIDEVAAALLVWFPGNQFGDALAAVLAGDAEPGGRLPLTFARRQDDYPALDTEPDERHERRYDEAGRVGYRHFDAEGIQPLFAFGHGLGYTAFELGDLRLERRGREVVAIVRVTNTGDRPGKEVVQAYISAAERPERALAAFAAVRLAPAASAEVELILAPEILRVWDTGRRRWQALDGVEVLVGRSVQDVPLRATLR